MLKPKKNLTPPTLAYRRLVMAVFVCVVVDDLEARTDPHRSFRTCTYNATPEQIEQLRQLVKSFARKPDPPVTLDMGDVFISR
jgi:hypothetical protein